REASQLRAQLVESRLQFLRAQLNPHFLSNTMNAVSALVTKDPKAVRRMLARLSELLRYTLEAPAEPEVPLEQELAVLTQYLEILEIRFQGRLRTSIAADPALMDALVPNLILQPLAENAMEHGVSQAAGSGSIEVSARRSGDYIVLTVQDTGASAEAEPTAPPTLPTSGGGYGLRHTRDRLEQLYGDDAHLELSPTAEGGMKAEVTLPYRTRPREPESAGVREPLEPTHA
ncbi:MAG: histidine kinase, partial [Gemmatimonadota bacterium]